jgi:hypothetical protein
MSLQSGYDACPGVSEILHTADRVSDIGAIFALTRKSATSPTQFGSIKADKTNHVTLLPYISISLTKALQTQAL